MIKNKNFALVIQGPLISSGNSGSGENKQSYDCNQNIKRYIDNFSSIIDCFVIATWESDNYILPSSISTKPQVKLLKLKDPGPNKTISSHLYTNDYRQFYGSLMGIKSAVGICNPDYIIKVRTDQFVDIFKICEHMLNVDSIYIDYQHADQEGFIFLPNILRWSPYSAGDFYIGGHAQDMLKFFEAQCKFKDHAFSPSLSWTHSDFILKHAYANLINTLHLEKTFYFPNIAPSFRIDIHGKPINFKYHHEAISLWSEILKKSISLYPKEITLNLEWRGEKVAAHQHSLGDFFKEWKDMHSDPKKWIIKNSPDQYLSKSSLCILQKFITFSMEKQYEILHGKRCKTQLLTQSARFLASLFMGQFPVNGWLLKKWVKLKSSLKKRRYRFKNN